MSQFYVAPTAGSLPPSVSEQFNTQNGNAVPLAHILIVNGANSTENNTNGIITKGGVVGTGTSNEVDVVLTNRITGSATTSDGLGQTRNLTTPFSIATVGTYSFNVIVAAYDTTDGASLGSQTFIVVRTTGATSTIVGQLDTFEAADAAILNTSTVINVSASGNTLTVQVTGIAGKTIDWTCVATYVYIG